MRGLFRSQPLPEAAGRPDGNRNRCAVIGAATVAFFMQTDRFG